MNAASPKRGKGGGVSGWAGGNVGEAAARGLLPGLLHSANSFKLHSGLFH